MQEPSWAAEALSDYVSAKLPFRPLHPGMGQAVAERTILRKLSTSDGHVLTPEEVRRGDPFNWENWGQVASRVAAGNCALVKDCPVDEYRLLRDGIANGPILMSGRHLQHGDPTQLGRGIEAFSNCSSACVNFLSFYLLLNGSGVGRCFDDDVCVVNWDYAPNVRCVLSEEHPDFDFSAHESARDARHKYGSGKNVLWHEVADTREGWAKALEIWEASAFQERHANKLLVLDFSKVRCKGSPIRGMQNRPASGPVPVMNAFEKAARIKGAGLEPWLQALFIDHYFSDCVLVGGARRAARLAMKHWKDPGIFDFIRIKRAIEFQGLRPDQVKEFRKQRQLDGLPPVSGFLWSANNSIGVDDEFWKLCDLSRKDEDYNLPEAKHARRVLQLTTECAYGDGSGEPGTINLHRLVQNNEGLKGFEAGDFVGSSRYSVEPETKILLQKLARRANRKAYVYVTNPCGEVQLLLLGAFCIIASVAPLYAKTPEEAEQAVRAVTRSLIRVNTMPAIYQKEVQRTNRIAVGLVGLHELAWERFGLTFRDLLDEEKSRPFWDFIASLRRAVADEAEKYSKQLGMVTPHTDTAIMPAGTIAKLRGLTEGAHLPPMKEYLRWVQFRNDDPLVATYEKAGFPIRKLKTYEGTTIVGFPTAPTITEMMPSDKIVTAAQATPEEQYRWVQLLEKYWITGVDADNKPLVDRGNSVSFTLKYDPETVDYKSFRDMYLKYQPTIKCCSVMPQEEVTSYEYQPEQPLSKAEYEQILRGVRREAIQHIGEDVGKEHVDCAGGVCPINFEAGSKDKIGG